MEKIIIQHGTLPDERGGMVGIGNCWIKCNSCGCIWETEKNMHIARGMTMEHCPECGKMCTGLCQNPQHANIIAR